MTNEQILQDANEAAEAAVDQGFFVTFQVTEDTKTAIYEYCSTAEPWKEETININTSDIELWTNEWRDRLYTLGCREFGVEED